MRRLAFLLLVACKKEALPAEEAKPKPSTSLASYAKPPPATCKSDADCAIATIEECCPAPCAGMAVFAVAAGSAWTRACGSEGSCGTSASNPTCVRLPRPSDYVAACRGGVCTAEARFDPRSLACETDADCALTGRPEGDRCTCCPMRPYATTTAGLRRENEDVERYCKPCGVQTSCPATKPTAPSVAKCEAKRCTVTVATAATP
ncbi:MAG TPA: hypothetical protein VIF62_02650 [Labilithrix sp.]|jgi:hypothetical protein